jgi:hypothetical protein
MAIEQMHVNNALVFYDDDSPFRWHKAIGEGVTEYRREFATLPSDSATGDATEWMVTLVETGASSSTHVVTDFSGGAIVLTTDDKENDGLSIQIGAVAGECVKLDGHYPGFRH